MRIILWGGTQLRLGLLEITTSGVATSSADSNANITLMRAVATGDWILDAAVVGSTAYMLTTHNVLLEVPITDQEEENAPATTHLTEIRGPGSFLYSGSVVVVAPHLIIVASGTVFGEIVVWTCVRAENRHQWSTSVRQVFKGHSGSIFGVSISDTFLQAGNPCRLLASCSDDRTVRIWDISSCDYSLQDENSSSLLSKETGFASVSQTERSHLASAWGHLSRIWGVEFVQRQTRDEDCEMLLLSRGEDAVCQLWSIQIGEGINLGPSITAHLAPRFNDRHHNGKNAWSMCQLRDGPNVTVYTGGADGQIMSRIFDKFGSSLDNSLTISTPFKEIIGSSKSLKNYQLPSDRTCLASTDSGEMFSFSADHGNLTSEQSFESIGNGGLIPCALERAGLTLIAHQRGGVSAFSTDSKTLLPLPVNSIPGISWMQIASPQIESLGSSTICVVAVLANKNVVVLWVAVNEGSYHVDRTDLRMPDTFTVSASCYDQSNRVLFLGSRAGALAVYSDVTPESEISGEAFCVRHMHGTDSVTSITVLGPSSRDDHHSGNSICVLTTGRDGQYALHNLVWPQALGPADPTASVVHLSTPPFGPNIEGAYFIPAVGSPFPGQSHLVLYGFRSTSFVVWNETQQSTLLAIECGGSHRNWAYRDFCALAASPSETNRTHLLEPKSTRKSFVWTKAGRFNWYTSDRTSRHKVLQTGGHGREIKAVARSRVSYGEKDNNLHDGTLIATGAEDTNIQIFALSRRASNKHSISPEADDSRTFEDESLDHNTFQSIATLKRHTTGLQHLQFSSSGSYLFSSAGCEEFYVWKLSFNVPCIGLGTVLWDIMPIEAGGESDARIMGFDAQGGEMLRTDNGERNETFLITMAYSTGKTKLMRYSPCSTSRNHGTFETLREITYGSFCVMQAFFLWPFPSLSPRHESPAQILSAGTNGFLNLSTLIELNVPVQGLGLPQPRSELVVHRTHQSSVLAMDVVALAERIFVIATGGDDNALALTVLRTPSKGFSHRFRTVLIPRAHAAAVTALKIATHATDQSETGDVTAVVVTVGNDQRVRVWNVRVDLDQFCDDEEDRGLCEAIHITRAGSAWTSVADVSGIEIVPEKDADHDLGADACNSSERKPRSEHGVLVVGVGMELLRMEWS